MGKYRVALIHNIIAPYRVPLFDALSKHPSIDLTVFFCAKTHKMRKWDILDEGTYTHEVLPGVAFEYKTLTYHVNPSIVWHLIRGRYDVVVIGGTTNFTMQAAFLISKLRGIKIVLWSERFKKPETLLGRILNPVNIFIAKNAQALIVPGKASRDYHANIPVQPEIIFVAPNIVDNGLFCKTCLQFRKDVKTLKESLNIYADKIILFVGRLDRAPNKGVAYLIKAFRRLKELSKHVNVHLVIVGDGDLRDKLEQMLVPDLIDDVHFTGWQFGKSLIRYYAAADVFVLPTLQDLCPLVLNEAMACSLPVVSTTAAGCARDMIVDGENGFIVEPRNVDALYEAIRRIVQDDELRQTMGKKSYETVSTYFSIDRAVNGWLKAIQFACQGASNKSH